MRKSTIWIFKNKKLFFLGESLFLNTFCWKKRILCSYFLTISWVINYCKKNTWQIVCTFDTSSSWKSISFFRSSSWSMSNCNRFHNEGLFFLSSNPLKVVMQQYSGTIIFLVLFSSINLQEEGWQINIRFTYLVTCKL